MMTPTVAVVVPACNEEAVIGGCLRALLRNCFGGLLKIMVSINGSTDRTAEVVAELGPEFYRRGWNLGILEIAQASKIAALNAADALVDADIRIYLDADALLSENAIHALAEALAGDRPTLAAPRLRALPGPGPISRACAAVWNALPPISDDVAGGGCYAVNRAGRARFAHFPDIIADDGFVRTRFARSERVLVRLASYSIPFPDDDMVVKIWARWLHGNMELEEEGYAAEDPGLLLRRVQTLTTSPTLWSKLPAFLITGVRAHRMARKRFLVHDRSWDRAVRTGRNANSEPDLCQ